MAYANGVYSCRAADLNEKPLAGDQCYWSAWATALSRANWSITTGCFGLMENDWCFPQDIITPPARSLSECTGVCVWDINIYIMCLCALVCINVELETALEYPTLVSGILPALKATQIKWRK